MQPIPGRHKAQQGICTEADTGSAGQRIIPVTVHLYLTEATDDTNPEERVRGMAAGMKILENCKYILVGDRYGISEGMKAELTFAAVKGKIMLYEKDGKIYLVNDRTETTGGMDHE